VTKTVVIVQARMTSTRLPGKVLLELAGKTVLSHVLRRCASIDGVDTVCCAVPDAAIHDAVAKEAESAGATVYRGAEDDVLDRYWQAARMLAADVVMRVTSDCPLVDPVVCAKVLRLLIDSKAEYACNNMPASWPHGLDCEAFTFASLKQAARVAVNPNQREHVTPWLRSNSAISKVSLKGPGGWAAEQRWTLDFPEDLDFFRALFACMPQQPALPSTKDVLELLQRRPDIAAINSRHHNISRPTVPSGALD
jgi:spore coat polysaccharide biosynthesis protein SpsF